MRTVSKPLALLLVAFLVAACAQPVFNVSRAPIITTRPNVSQQDIASAIVRAGTSLGWQMVPDRPGHVLGTLTLREHVAVVDIDYDATTYSINYKTSSNLDYANGQIHKNYNGWIHNLDARIRQQIAIL